MNTKGLRHSRIPSDTATRAPRPYNIPGVQTCKGSEGRIVMSTVMHGVVHGRTIELRESPGVPDGQEVEVVVKAVEPRGSWGEGILRSAGVAADVPGFDEAFAEIQRDRKRTVDCAEPRGW